MRTLYTDVSGGVCESSKGANGWVYFRVRPWYYSQLKLPSVCFIVLASAEISVPFPENMVGPKFPNMNLGVEYES